MRKTQAVKRVAAGKAAQRLPRLLSRSFFAGDPRDVARELLGKVLLRRDAHGLRAGRIVEAEAYLGADDAAAHAAAGETARNRVLFGPSGHAYVYFTYGMHYCFNVSCMPEGDAGCVLIRALEPLAGIVAMAKARGCEIENGTPSALRLISSGPARLCEALGITRERDNGKDLTNSSSDLWVGEDEYAPAGIVCTPRIGITKSVEMPLRYFIVGNQFVSGKR
jgi:DNA-3-methyladenine glycosylase